MRFFLDIARRLSLSMLILIASMYCCLAGGTVDCSTAIYFNRSRLNVMLGQYEFAGNTPPDFQVPDEDWDVEAIGDDFQKRMSRLTTTAQQLIWLLQLDLFINSGFRGFSVASLYAEGSENGGCSAEEILDTLVRRYHPSSQNKLALLTGRIYQEGNITLLQSDLRAFQFANGISRRLDALTLPINLSSRRLLFSAPFWNDKLVFPARPLSTIDISSIFEQFSRSILIYPTKGGGKPKLIQRPIADSRKRLVFSLEQIDPDGWMKIKIHGSESSGWVKSDFRTHETLRKLLPEADVLSGLVGLLLSRSDGKASPSMAEPIDKFFRSYLDNAESTDPSSRRAAVEIIRGSSWILNMGATRAAWIAGRQYFMDAANVDPGNITALNLIALADISLCCSDREPSDAETQEVLQSLQGILARQPNDRNALENLQLFYEFLAEKTPSREAQANLDNIKVVRQTLGYCAKC